MSQDAESGATIALSQDAESAAASPGESSFLVTARSVVPSPGESSFLVKARSAVPFLCSTLVGFTSALVGFSIVSSALVGFSFICSALVASVLTWWASSASSWWASALSASPWLDPCSVLFFSFSFYLSS